MDDEMKILVVCMGNTCRSPMAKVIMEQKLMAVNLPDKWEIDSAAYGIPTLNRASKEAREAIKIKYGQDLLASHQPRRITPELMQWADIILVMTNSMKQGLPQNKTFTLKELAGGLGDISDPYGQGVAVYLQVADEIAAAIDKIIAKPPTV